MRTNSSNSKRRKALTREIRKGDAQKSNTARIGVAATKTPDRDEIVRERGSHAGLMRQLTNLVLVPPNDEEIQKEREAYAKEMGRLTAEGLALVLRQDGVRETVQALKDSTEEEFVNEIRLEAIAKNLYAEIAGIERTKEFSPFNKTRKKLFLAVGELIERASVCPEPLKQSIRESGEQLHQCDGFQGMSDPLVWLFIPKALHRDIEFIWDGIGEWKA